MQSGREVSDIVEPLRVLEAYRAHDARSRNSPALTWCVLCAAMCFWVAPGRYKLDQRVSCLPVRRRANYDRGRRGPALIVGGVAAQ